MNGCERRLPAPPDGILRELKPILDKLEPYRSGFRLVGLLGVLAAFVGIASAFV
jgi:hypothetical protein